MKAVTSSGLSTLLVWQSASNTVFEVRPVAGLKNQPKVPYGENSDLGQKEVYPKKTQKEKTSKQNKNMHTCRELLFLMPIKQCLDTDMDGEGSQIVLQLALF